MSGLQLSSAGAAPPTPDFTEIFHPSDLMPRPLSEFPTATQGLYDLYTEYWRKRNENFNAFVAQLASSYQDILAENGDGFYDHILEAITGAVSESREALVMGLGEMEQRFVAWFNSSSD